MNPAFLDNMSWEMAEVYGAITDQILINLAHYFPYYKPGDPLPRTSFEYQSAMLAQMGKVNQDTVRIIRNGLADADDALKDVLEQAIIDGVRKIEPELLRAALDGIIDPAKTPVVSANQMRAFQLYYNQSATKLNLVNTVMLESTMQAYQGTVSSIVSEMELSERMNRVQIALDASAGETITGVSTWNQAMRHGIDRLKENGITGFIDHAGRRWSAESYVAMDVRTTVYNTGRAAVWETNESFGNDLYIVSYHDGARPLCYPWQNKVISSTDTARTVQDLDGNEIRVYAQSETTYGQAAGLFGINCKHYPSPFIPGVSVSYDQSNIQNEAENEKVYEQTQEQRGLERKIREQKRDWLMAKAQNASADELRALRDDIRQTSAEIDEFCDKTGLPRRKNREGVYTKREFPAADTYDPRTFANDQKKIIDGYFGGGGAQQGYKFGQMQPKVPVAPQTSPIVPQNVASQATQAEQNVIQSRSKGGELLIKQLEAQNIARNPVTHYADQPQENEIIRKIAGADKTRGSCSSCALAYAGNKNGLDVTDYRGGASQRAFSTYANIRRMLDFDGVVGTEVSGTNDFTKAHKLLQNVGEGKEYYFTSGKHAAVVRKSSTGIEYLELQSGWRKNTWYALNDVELKRRFGCQRSHTLYGEKVEVKDLIIDIDSLRGNKDFEEMLEFINTATGQQMKGAGGGEK